MSFHFDWYQGSIASPPQDVLGPLGLIASDLGLVGREEKPGLHGYGTRLEFVCEDGGRHVSMMFGGSNPGTNLRGSGSMAVPIADFMRSNFPVHKVSRADVAMDLSEEGLFSNLKAIALAHAAQNNISTRLISDPNKPEEGETLYVGGKTSPLTWRIYQKGFEQLAKGRCKPEEVDRNWVRIEAEIKPLTRDKLRFSTIGPQEMLGYARWSRILAAEILALDLEPIYRSERDASSFWIAARYGVESYGNALMRAGIFELAAYHGQLEPTNSEAIDQVVHMIRAHLRNLYPDNKPFDPGFEVLDAIRFAHESQGVSDAG